jgi:hypothetical protein
LEFFMRAKPHGHKVSLDTLKKLAVQPHELPDNQYKIIEAQLRAAIIDGSLKPDDSLTQQAIADALGARGLVCRRSLLPARAACQVQIYALARRRRRSAWLDWGS